MAVGFTATADGMAVPTGAVSTLLEVDQVANRQIRIKQVSIMFDGVNASAVPIRVQLCQVTAASAAGTAVTPASSQSGNYGTLGVTAKKLPASEGTVTVLEEHRIPPTTGELVQIPLGDEYQINGAAASASGFSIRAIAGAAVNATCVIKGDE